MMPRNVVHSDEAPKAIGPYSQAIRAGHLLFCSGQIPLDPKTGEMVGAGDVREQAKRVMQNLEAVLEAGGSSFGGVMTGATTWMKLSPAVPAVRKMKISAEPAVMPQAGPPWLSMRWREASRPRAVSTASTICSQVLRLASCRLPNSEDMRR